MSVDCAGNHTRPRGPTAAPAPGQNIEMIERKGYLAVIVTDWPIALVPEGEAGGQVVEFVSRVDSKPVVVAPEESLNVTVVWPGISAGPDFLSTVAMLPIVTVQVLGNVLQLAPCTLA